MTTTTATQPVDVLVQNEGTISILYGKTAAGRDWLAENLDPDAQRWGGGYVVAHRYVSAILVGALDADLNLGGI